MPFENLWGEVLSQTGFAAGCLPPGNSLQEVKRSEQPADPAGACSKHQAISNPSHKGRQGEHRGLSQGSLIKKTDLQPSHTPHHLSAAPVQGFASGSVGSALRCEDNQAVTQGSCCKAPTAQPHGGSFQKCHPTPSSLQENLSNAFPPKLTFAESPANPQRQSFCPQ